MTTLIGPLSLSSSFSYSSSSRTHISLVLRALLGGLKSKQIKYNKSGFFSCPAILTFCLSVYVSLVVKIKVVQNVIRMSESQYPKIPVSYTHLTLPTKA